MKKVIIILLSIVCSVSLWAEQVFYVVEGGAGNKDGTSWANAYADVQTAIDKASSAGGGEVWIKAGTYKYGSAMTMKNNVAIYGGFAGTETSKEQRVAGNNTILDGEGKYRVFWNNYTEDTPLTKSSKLDNVTIQNGYTSSDGAGMYNCYASPEITNCTFANNSVTRRYNYDVSISGGGMYNYHSDPVLINCSFEGNNISAYSESKVGSYTASANGGGVCNYASNPKFLNTTFVANTVFASSYATYSKKPSSYGGGMYNKYSSPILMNCTFVDNTVSTDSTSRSSYGNGYGGGMYNEDSSSFTLTNCILWANTASSSGNEIYNSGSSSNPTIDTCIIQNGKSGIYNSSYGTYTNIITEDPKLMPLGNYGGSVQTCPVSVGSPAIGAGKVIEGVTTDARGVARSTTAPTIGAYEYVKVQTAFESWAENTGLTGDNALPSAIPHNDGITNLEKFTFGLDASKATSYDANVNFKHSTDASGNASLQFSVNVDAEGVVNVKALKSVDLINWVETTATATGEISSDGKFKIYKATAPVGEEGKVFLKLKVEEK